MPNLQGATDPGRAVSPFLLVADVAARYGEATKTTAEKARLGLLPHRRLPRSRRILFLEADLVAYEGGAELERVELRDGGRIVRPVRRDT